MASGLREEKVLDVALEVMINRVNDLKNAIVNFIMKLEHEHENLNWPSVLDSFALLSGQISLLLRAIKNEKTPILRNLITLPLMLSPERDEELAKITENRVPAFSHEVVPDYLRTKPDPEVEAREQQIMVRASSVSYDAGQRQINAVNKITNNIHELVNTHKDEWESEAGARANTTQTSSMSDTYTLISAICLGKGLKQIKSQVAQPNQQTNQPSQVSSGPVSKAPSSIKTNIKAASSIHPYGR